MSLEFHDISIPRNANIKVVGVGGAGGNAVNNMITSALQGVEFISANTDMQVLDLSLAETKIQLGTKLTKGLGAGANPLVGAEAAQESLDEIRANLEGADMVFVTAGMGGGTGTGAAPVIAKVARECGALTVGVVSKPFHFEGKHRLVAATEGIAELKQYVDSLITLPNDRLMQMSTGKATFYDMLKKADQVLYEAVRGISDLIMVPGLINLDFADVRAVMGNSGLAVMGIGTASGEDRAKEAANKAITSPLLEGVTIDGARHVLLNITCNADLGIHEVSDAAAIVQKAAHEDVNVFFGTVRDDSMGDEIRITVVATGIEDVTPQGIGVTKKSGTASISSGNKRTEVFEEHVAASKAPVMQKDDLRQASVPNKRNFNIPAYLQPIKSYADGSGQPLAVHAPGEEDFIFEEGDFDTPTFLRKQAN